MPIFRCSHCEKIFNIKCNYQRHLNMHNDDKVISTPDKIQICQYCNQTFATTDKLNYHIHKTCKSSPYQEKRDELLQMKIAQAKKDEMIYNAIEQQNKKIEQQNKKIAELTGQLALTDARVDDVTETVQDRANKPIINIEQLQVNLYINDFGSEKSIHQILTFDQKKHLLQQGGDTVKKLVENKHYNKNCPENQPSLQAKVVNTFSL